MSRPGFRVRAVLFDFDGTLTAPGALDFPRIKQALGAPPEQPILEFLAEVADEERRLALYRQLEEFEAEAAARSHPNPGAEQLLGELRARGLPLGIVTRNGRRAVELALENFEGLRAEDFDVLVTRDVPVAPKPAPDGLLFAAERLGCRPSEVVFVGDHWLDTDSAAAAGAVGVLLENRGAGEAARRVHTPAGPGHAPPDFVIDELVDLMAVVELGLPLPVGKLPETVLGAFLDEQAAGRGGAEPDGDDEHRRTADAAGDGGHQRAAAGDAEPRRPADAVLLGPRLGEDVAAVSVDAGVLVLKSDPVTFTATDIARYAVTVNANDVATSGAVPRWFLATVLLPVGTTASEARRLLDDLADQCAAAEVALVGGHSEVTDAVRRPVVIGTLAGTVPTEGLLRKERMAAGDRIVLTKRVAAEGTAVLSQERADRLREGGVTENELEAARGLADELSVVPEARLAAAVAGVTGLHDVTEGGLATGLREIGLTAGCVVEADPGRVPAYDVTLRFAQVLGFDPLGMLGSGSLLIACRASGVQELLEALEAGGVEACEIGRLREPGQGEEPARVVDTAGSAWPRFARDEIARLLEEA